MSETYDVNVIFRGLFLAKPTPYGLAILLPDGRAPQRLLPTECFSVGQESDDEANASLNSKVGPYEEHYGVLEFAIEDWRNETADIPHLARVEKPAKGQVALYFLGEKKSAFSATDLIGFSTSRLGGLLTPELRWHPSCYSSPEGLEGLRVLEHDDEFSLSRLPPYEAGISETAWKRSVAVSLIPTGEVYSERPSLRDGKPLNWYFVAADEFLCETPANTDVEARPINLDLHVRFAVGADELLVVELFKILRTASSGPDLEFLPAAQSKSELLTLLLYPKDVKRGITVWIKNRELSRILFDSDLEDDPVVVCPREIARDRDHGLLMRLAAEPGRVLIPHLKTEGTASCGSACGGCGG